MIRLVHLSDHQIRNFQRHDEFRKSQDFLYDSLREKKPDVIVFVGDLAHGKTHISPELVQMISNYLSSLASIAPLILIPGNHDLNLNNLSRLDTLTPIVEALRNRNIYYYKDSGVYRLPNGLNGNVVVFSCLDDKWPLVEDVKQKIDPINNQFSIGLYHGMVNGAVLQNGMIVEDCQYTTKQSLEIVDYLMMGDIHRQQFLDDEKRAAYCGSYPQQSFGEGLNKGYLLWDIESKDKHKVEFIKLPNVHPYYIIDLPDDILLTEQLPIQEQARIRVDSRQLTPVEKSVLRKKLNKLYNPHEIFFKDDVNAHKQEIQTGLNIKIEDLSDVGVQDRLIRGFLESYNLSEDMLNRVCELNSKYDSEVRQTEDIIRNVQYRILKLKWSNITSYGEDNEFDFSERKGSIGIFGKNAVGKSSLAVDVLLSHI